MIDEPSSVNASALTSSFSANPSRTESLAKELIDEFDLSIDLHFQTPSRLESNPLVWSVNHKGVNVDARLTSLDEQREYANTGAIPYVMQIHLIESIQHYLPLKCWVCADGDDERTAYASIGIGAEAIVTNVVDGGDTFGILCVIGGNGCDVGITLTGLDPGEDHPLYSRINIYREIRWKIVQSWSRTHGGTQVVEPESSIVMRRRIERYS
jgi:hypothetical protein